MEQLPLEIFRDIIEHVSSQLALKELWKLRLVSRTFEREVCEAAMRRLDFDEMFHKFWRHGNSTLPYTYADLGNVGFGTFPESLKPRYFYHQLKRSGRDSDVLWEFVKPVYEFEINELNEEEEGDVDRVLFEVCEGVIIPRAEQSKLFTCYASHIPTPSPDSPQPPRESEASTPRPVKLRQTALLCRLNRAIRKRDSDGVTLALKAGAKLDWKPMNDVLPWFGGEYLSSGGLRDEETPSDTYDCHSSCSDLGQLFNLVRAMRTAVKDLDKLRMQHLLWHPADFTPTESILNKVSGLENHMHWLQEARSCAFKSAKWVGAKEVLAFFNTHFFPPEEKKICIYLSDAEREEIRKQVEIIEMIRDAYQSRRRGCSCRDSTPSSMSR